jgi:FkbM family methyltransferase
MRKRFDIVDVLTIAAVAVVVSTGMWRRAIPGANSPPGLVEEDVLASVGARYGLEKVSQGPEEWLIRDFFADAKNGVFVDVGAYNPKKWSNTYTLEHDFGWSGIAIDAMQEFATGYRELRPASRFVVAFVADKDVGTKTLFITPKEVATSSGDAAFAHQYSDAPVRREVPVRTLDGILQEFAVSHVDLLSMDIELGEPVALAHFSIEKYRPRLAVIEAQGLVRQAILDYFTRARYVVVGRYLHADTQNLYFRPLDAATDGTRPPVAPRPGPLTSDQNSPVRRE